MQIGHTVKVTSGPYTGKVGEIVRINHAHAGVVILWLAVSEGDSVTDIAVNSTAVSFYAF